MKASRKPRICVSLERHWVYRFGIDWLTYRRLIHRAGGTTFVVDPTKPLPDDGFDGLLLAGGSDIDPKVFSERGVVNGGTRRDVFEMRLIDHAAKQNVPILGVCRGCQLLNVAFGGTLKTLPGSSLHRVILHRFLHRVALRQSSHLFKIVGERRLLVRSLHRHVIGDPGRGMAVVAKASDHVPEAIERTDSDLPFWCIGVQWHPELIFWNADDKRLAASFVEACRDAMIAQEES